MFYIPDNYDKWLQHESEQEEELQRLPLCCECEERITDEHCYEVNGEYICERCMDENHKKDTDLLIG